MAKGLTESERTKLEKEWQEALRRAGPIRLSGAERADLQMAYFVAKNSRR